MIQKDKTTGKKTNNCRVKARFGGDTKRSHRFMIGPNEFNINGSIYIFSKENGIVPDKMVGELLADSKAIVEQIQGKKLRFSWKETGEGVVAGCTLEDPVVMAHDLFEKWQGKGDTDEEEV